MRPVFSAGRLLGVGIQRGKHVAKLLVFAFTGVSIGFHRCLNHRSNQLSSSRRFSFE